LHADCEEGLDEEGGAEVGAEPVEDPVGRGVVSVCVFIRLFWTGEREQGLFFERLGEREGLTYFKMLATSMIKGMSSEKPAELRVLWIE
jgi:hypothetical protein